MIDLNQLKPKIETLLSQSSLRLCELKWYQYQGKRVLEVAILDQYGNMDLDTCEQQSMKISALLSEVDEDEGEYLLEVCSPGAERELHSLEEIREEVGSYLYCQLKEPRDGVSYYQGFLEAVEGSDMMIKIRVKTREKTVKVAYEEARLVRLAVKV